MMNRGSFTIEASFLLAIFMTVFVICLFGLFYLHDRAVARFRGEECLQMMLKSEMEPVDGNGKMALQRLNEAAVLHISGKYALSKEEAKARFMDAAGEETFFFQPEWVQVGVTNEDAVLSYGGWMEGFGGTAITGSLFQLQDVQVTVTRNREASPEQFIRLTRGLKGEEHGK